MKKRSYKTNLPFIDGPLLAKVKVNFTPDISFDKYPFSLPIIKKLTDIDFPTQVTFFVGENGTGKSTILEAIAHNADLGAEGGSKNINFKTAKEEAYHGTESLAHHLTLSWRSKPFDSYFFRAESFFNVANYIDTLVENGGPEKAYGPYGGKSLHQQSHGESFFSFFKNRLGSHGFFILDEPEAALSPERQLSFMVIMHELCKNPHVQLIIATHSPLLLAYPNATIYSCDSGTLKPIAYTDTPHYQVTKNFLNNTQHYLKHLLSE